VATAQRSRAISTRGIESRGRRRSNHWSANWPFYADNPSKRRPGAAADSSPAALQRERRAQTGVAAAASCRYDEAFHSRW